MVHLWFLKINSSFADTDFVALGHNNNAWNVVSVFIGLKHDASETDLCVGAVRV